MWNLGCNTHCCTFDSFRYDENGEYRWSAETLASTHEACQMKARENCEGGTNVVIIGKQIVRVSISTNSDQGSQSCISKFLGIRLDSHILFFSCSTNKLPFWRTNLRPLGRREKLIVYFLVTVGKLKFFLIVWGR